MCLAIPGKVTEIFTENGMRMAKVDFGGVIRSTCLEAVPDALVGQYVIVHAGFALNILSAEEAQETLDIFKKMDEFDSEQGQP